jgi:hypothetical protein
MREQRHARRANRARAEADYAGVNMADIVAQAERDQQAQATAPPPPPQANVSRQMTLPRDASDAHAVILDHAQMKELFRRQRHELQMNRERIKRQRDGARDFDPPPQASSVRRPSARQVEDEERRRQLDEILDQAMAVNEALDNLDGCDPVGTADTGEASSPFFLQNKVVNFPVVRDGDSLSYRAEAVRAFLEREIGLDKLLALKQAVSSDGESPGLADILRDCEPGVIVLAQQLLVLEESIDAM